MQPGVQQGEGVSPGAGEDPLNPSRLPVLQLTGTGAMQRLAASRACLHTHDPATLPLSQSHVSNVNQGPTFPKSTQINYKYSLMFRYRASEQYLFPINRSGCITRAVHGS